MMMVMIYYLLSKNEIEWVQKELVFETVPKEAVVAYFKMSRNSVEMEGVSQHGQPPVGLETLLLGYKENLVKGFSL
jgi:hypothetical protein